MPSAEREAMVREIICGILEMEEDELTLTGQFLEDYGADSMNAIEIVSRIEVVFGIEIAREDLKRMVDLKTVLELLDTAKAK
ncbi:acyl carrier protein [Streptomyces sp. NPDC050548]|uniref:acyl carrier protein n=1 Tax=Streptomyces sp. NPDC050548 TaxID=3365629 RepID=UPI0037878D02